MKRRKGRDLVLAIASLWCLLSMVGASTFDVEAVEAGSGGGTPLGEVFPLRASLPEGANPAPSLSPHPSPTRVEFEALELKTGRDYDCVYCYFRLAEEAAIRVPSADCLNPVGEGSWDIAGYEFVVEVPPEGPLRVYVECYDYEDPLSARYLGLLDMLHYPEDWDGRVIWARGEGGEGFQMAYRINLISPPEIGWTDRLEDIKDITDGAARQLEGLKDTVERGVEGRCLPIFSISGEIYGFPYDLNTLKIKVCPAETIKIQPYPNGPTKTITRCKPVGVWYIPISPPEFTQMRVAYIEGGFCPGTYIVTPVYQPYEDVCEWRGDWEAPRERIVTIVNSNAEGNDFRFIPIENEAPEIAIRPRGRILGGRRHGQWRFSVDATDPSGIQKIKITGTYTTTFFTSDESGPLPPERRPPSEIISSFSKECNASPCEFFIPHLENVKSIALDLRISACDGVGNKAETSYQWIFPDEPGDLSIVSIEPVQVVYGAPLVKNKGTAFRVRVNSNFSHPIETKFRLILPNTQWGVVKSTGHFLIALSSSWRYPEIWGPIKIRARAINQEIMLPIIPDWQREVNYSSGDFAARIIGGREVGGIYGPDVRAMPKPIADSVDFTVEIDPEDEVNETNEGNNTMVSSNYEVVTTKRVKIYFVIQAVDPTQNHLINCSNINCAPDPDCCSNYNVITCTVGSTPRTLNDLCQEVKEFAKNSIEYFLGIYPVADSKISYSVDCNLKYQVNYSDFMEAMLDLAKRNGYDYVLAVTPWGRCGACDTGSHGCFIELYGTPVNAAHELAGHGIQRVDDCYSCSPIKCPDCIDIDCASCGASEGFWVNKWIAYESGTFGVRPPTYYMDMADIITKRWTRLDRTWRFSDGNLLNGGYLQLIEMSRDEGDPKILLVRGRIYKDGSAKLGPFTIIEDGVVDIEPGEEGDYYIVLIDSQQKVLSKIGFDVSFYMFRPEGKVETDKVSFVYRIEWKEGTKRIELQDKDGNVLASREVSAHKPEIRVVYPNGGEVWEKGKSYTIKWEANDKDGDALIYSIAISENGGETWLPIDIDVEANEYELNTLTLNEGKDYLIKVRATDGVNTGEDVSDGTFTVRTRGFPTRYFIVGIVLLVASALALGILARRERGQSQ